VVETYEAEAGADAGAGGGACRRAGPDPCRLAISHFDFYRFSDARELIDAGLRELFAAPGLKLVEWPSHAAALLPQADLRLLIEPEADEGRRVRAQAYTPRGLELIA
jgi:tRNA threonylcarbamoyladenosine biosynthesis protein TsaE